MKKILITGGACAGKTTVINLIHDYLIDKKYDIEIIEEVPTKLIYEGITPNEIGKMEFQELIIKIQIDNENNCKEEKIYIFDGSPIDSMKSITKEEFDGFVEKYNSSFEKIINGYDGIIFLETVAKDFPELYSTENNKARLKDINAAIIRNDKLLEIYNNNSNVYLIKPDKDIEVKKKRIIEIIDKVLKKI